MTSAGLLTVAAIPELLYTILEYLEQGDTYSLLLTCQRIYPIAYKHLWKTIRLYNRGKQQMAEPGFFTSNLISQHALDPLLFHSMAVQLEDQMCYKLANAIDTLGPENTGLSLTRKLVFAPDSLHSGNGFYKSSLMSYVDAFMQKGILNLNCIELNFSISVRSEEQKEAVSWFLTHLREYSKSKSPDEFSIILTSPLDVVMARMIDIEKVTELSLSINWSNSGGNAFQPDEIKIPVEEDDSDAYWHLEPEPDSDDSRDSDPVYRRRARRDRSQFNTQLTERLTALLLRAVNLTSLAISTRVDDSERGKNFRYVDLRFSKPLQTLQNAFYSLPKLRKLEIRDKFFHPSYFITPPDSTTEVSYSGILSNRWLQSFKRCSFTNVKRLSLHINRDNSDKRRWCRNDFNVLPLGDVAVSGLTECSIVDEMDTAPDLAQCIFKRNKNLDKASKQRVLATLAGKLQLIANKQLLAACENSLDYIKETEKDNPLYGKPTDSPYSRDEGITEAGNQCLKMLPKAIDNIEQWNSAKSSAVLFAEQCEVKINSLLARYKTMLTMEYTQKYLTGAGEHPGDLEKASKECLQRMLDNFDNHSWWGKAQPYAHNIAFDTSHIISHRIRRFTHTESSEYILALAESGELESLDIGMVAEKFTRDCAQKLSGMELEGQAHFAGYQTGRMRIFNPYGGPPSTP
ncbi:hypothetical protein TWF506_009822 [Arthrobotrys conoides]|uniref:F-box domain-containing protein n=1 Tax=Arthrobotrys conoides TaxID=74498 RepID=A0AAN8RWE6_9PEZI